MLLRKGIYTAGGHVSHGIHMDEQVRCNICGVSIDVSKATEHATLQSHAEQKARLEDELDAAKSAQYDHDSSVAG